MNAAAVFRVHIEHNLVCAIERVTRTPDMEVATSPLEVSTRLASNHQRSGCIDGRYHLADAEQARSFALLALDFVQRIAERRARELQALDSGAGYVAGRG